MAAENWGGGGGTKGLHRVHEGQGNGDATEIMTGKLLSKFLGVNVNHHGMPMRRWGLGHTAPEDCVGRVFLQARVNTWPFIGHVARVRHLSKKSLILTQKRYQIRVKRICHKIIGYNWPSYIHRVVHEGFIIFYDPPYLEQLL